MDIRMPAVYAAWRARSLLIVFKKHFSSYFIAQ
jgi:hypothetical protein